MITLVLVLKEIKQIMTHFIHTQKQKQLMKVTLMIMYLNQSTLQVHQIQNSLGKVLGWIIDSAVGMIMNDNECLK